jgi:homoserine kinase type II
METVLSTQDQARFAGTCRSEDASNALDDAGLARVLEHYALGDLRTARQLEQGFVNDNYVLETTRGRYFLKRRHPSLRRADVIRAQHALIGWISAGGFPAPRLAPTEEGETLLVLEEQYYEIQGFIEGTPYDHGRPAHLEEAGTVLGRYHRAVEGFNPAVLSRGDLYNPEMVRTNVEDLTEAWGL